MGTTIFSILGGGLRVVATDRVTKIDRPLGLEALILA
jgi:hypothetical protein